MQYKSNLISHLGRPELYCNLRPTADVSIFSARSPSSVAVELCHVIGSWNLRFIIQVPKFGGRWASPPKKCGVKNMQNSARFWTTSYFDLEYFRDGRIYQQESPANAKGTRDSSACMKAHCEQM